MFKNKKYFLVFVILTSSNLIQSMSLSCILDTEIKDVREFPEGSESFTAILANGDTLHADRCPKTGQIFCLRSFYNPHGAEIMIPVSLHYFHVLKKIVQEKKAVKK